MNPCTVDTLASFLTTDEGVPGIREWIDSFRGHLFERLAIELPGFGYFELDKTRAKFKAKTAFYDEVHTGKKSVRTRDDVVGAIAKAFHAGHDAVVMPGIGTFFSIPRESGDGVWVKLKDDGSFDAQTRAELEVQLWSTDGEARAYAIGKLAQRDGADLAKRLAAVMLDDRSITRRRHAAHSLAALDKARLKPVLAALTTAATDRDATIRAEALMMLGEIGAPASAALIVSALEDKTGECRNAAVVAASKLGAAAKPALPAVAALYPKAKTTPQREHLARILGTLHEPTVTALIESALRDKDREVQFAVLEGLPASKRAPARPIATAITTLITEAQADKQKVIAGFGGRDELDDLGHQLVDEATRLITLARKVLAIA